MAANPNAKVQRYLPRNFINVLGKNLPAIYEAFNRNIEVTEELIQACIDQLFLSTAAGKYLVQLGEEQGFVMPSNSGLDIRSYRVLVPVMVSEPKQVRFTIDQLIQAFYQNQRTRPSILSEVFGPYNIDSGDDIIIETERGEVSVSITDKQVSDVNEVSAQEIASVFNSSQDFFFAEAVTDRVSGSTFLRLTSSTFGSGAFIRVRGGKLQNILRLPNIIDTAAAAFTTWILSKDSVYTDILRFTWDGAGTNPNIYRVNVGDIVTIRDQIDTGDPHSLLNGSFEIVETGYDYFVVRNERFNLVGSTLVQGTEDDIVFTSQDKVTLFDNDEFALTSETNDQTITITVPAVPPLARRFLQGSAHIHGDLLNIIDFTRNSAQVEILDNQEIPVGVNNFVLTNKYQRFDFTKKYFKTESIDTNPSQPTYIVNSEGEEFSTLPFTVPTVFGTDPVYGELDDVNFRAVFDFPHGLNNFWGFTLSGLTGEANILAGDLNKEQAVRRVDNKNEVTFRLYDGTGIPIAFDGITVANSDVYRHSSAQSDGSDFYMDFGTAAAAIASGYTPGTTFRFDNVLGTNINTFYGQSLRFKKLTVTSITDEKVNFSAGLGTGAQGLIITDIPTYRSGFFGGTGSYFLDKASDLNTDRVFEDLRAMYIGYSQSQNPDYIGPYVYDPDGEETNVTISRLKVESQNTIFKGESRRTIDVDDTDLGDEQLPQTGKIVINYGTSQVEGPIPYNAYVKNIGSTQILIDPSYEFQKSHEPGAQIFFIHDNQAYAPEIDGSDYPFYITGTTEARNTLFNLIELLVASGIFVESDVILPELRYADPAISPFE